MQILIIQTAFIGDVVLATSVAEKMHKHFPNSRIDFLVKEGHAELFDNHPFIRTVFTFNKRKKVRSFIEVVRSIRSVNYDVVINLHRFLSSGLMTVLSGADQTIGFSSNPLSLLFSERYPHHFNGQHEVERNLSLLENIVAEGIERPRLYINHVEEAIQSKYSRGPYITISPGSIWETKKTPLDKWLALIQNTEMKVYLLGSANDRDLCEELTANCREADVANLAGQLSMLQSAALMKHATMNYTNDSAPLHFASAVNASVTAVFCSTVPTFGFGPLSDVSFIAETNEKLPCRPCGIHGRMSCPEGHFNCGKSIDLLSLNNQKA